MNQWMRHESREGRKVLACAHLFAEADLKRKNSIVVQSFAIKKKCQPKRTVIKAKRVADGRKIKTAFSMSVHLVEGLGFRIKGGRPFPRLCPWVRDLVLGIGDHTIEKAVLLLHV